MIVIFSQIKKSSLALTLTATLNLILSLYGMQGPLSNNQENLSLTSQEEIVEKLSPIVQTAEETQQPQEYTASQLQALYDADTEPESEDEYSQRRKIIYSVMHDLDEENADKITMHRVESPATKTAVPYLRSHVQTQPWDKNFITAKELLDQSDFSEIRKEITRFHQTLAEENEARVLLQKTLEEFLVIFEQYDACIKRFSDSSQGTLSLAQTTLHENLTALNEKCKELKTIIFKNKNLGKLYIKELDILKNSLEKTCKTINREHRAHIQTIIKELEKIRQQTMNTQESISGFFNAKQDACALALGATVALVHVPAAAALGGVYLAGKAVSAAKRRRLI